jgi:hypothetical protein
MRHIVTSPEGRLRTSAVEVLEACTALAPFIDYFNVIAGSIGTCAGLCHIVPQTW